MSEQSFQRNIPTGCSQKKPLPWIGTVSSRSHIPTILRLTYPGLGLISSVQRASRSPGSKRFLLLSIGRTHDHQSPKRVLRDCRYRAQPSLGSNCLLKTLRNGLAGSPTGTWVRDLSVIHHSDGKANAQFFVCTNGHPSQADAAYGDHINTQRTPSEGFRLCVHKVCQ